MWLQNCKEALNWIIGLNIVLVGPCCVGEKLLIIKFNKPLSNAYAIRMFAANDRQILMPVLIKYIQYRVKKLPKSIENRNSITNTPADVRKFQFRRISVCLFKITYFEMSINE